MMSDDEITEMERENAQLESDVFSLEIQNAVLKGELKDLRSKLDVANKTIVDLSVRLDESGNPELASYAWDAMQQQNKSLRAQLERLRGVILIYLARTNEAEDKLDAARKMSAARKRQARIYFNLGRSGEQIPSIGFTGFLKWNRDVRHEERSR